MPNDKSVVGDLVNFRGLGGGSLWLLDWPQDGLWLLEWGFVGHNGIVEAMKALYRHGRRR